MPSAAPSTIITTMAGAAENGQSCMPATVKSEVKPFFPPPKSGGAAPSSSSTGPFKIDGHEEDLALSKSEYLTRIEVKNRRVRRLKHLARIYREHYWALMEQVKFKHREYYWEYGKSPFQEDQQDNDTTMDQDESFGANKGNSDGSGINRCEVHGCKAKAMALTRFCHIHILSDPRQKLYKSCDFAIKSSPTGPITCRKAILRSTVPSYCPLHFQKAEKHVARALKKAGLNVSSTNRVAPKLHVIFAEYVRQIQSKRKAAAQKAILDNAEVKEENHS